MQAAVLKADGSLVVESVPAPHPEPGEVVLRVRDCGICGSDLHAAAHPWQLPPDSIMGHEFSGEVAELGSGVTGWREGERVVSLPYASCGTCPACVAGDSMRCPSLRGIGLGQLPGAYAEFVRADPKNLLRIPDGVSFRTAALVEPLAVGLRGVRRSRLAPGGSCVIMGAGPIGLVTLLWARQQGAATVVVSEMAAGRAQLAQRLGAAAVVNPSDGDPAAVLKERSGAEAALIFECVGVKGTLNAALTMAGTRGEVIVLGVCTDMDEIFPLAAILKELEVKFILGYTPEEFAMALGALADGSIDVQPLITDVIDLAELPATFQRLTRPSTQAKVLLEFA